MLKIENMRKNYVAPSVLWLPMQIVGPNAGISGEDSGGMHPIDAKEGVFEEDDDFNMNSRWGE